MVRATPFIPSLLVAAGLVLACHADPAPTPVPTKVEPPRVDADGQEVDGPVAAAAPAVAVAVQDGVPTISSDAAIYEFGAIKATDSVEHVFPIRNTGTADLKIERVQRT